MIKAIISTLLFVISCNVLSAQTFEVPKDYQLITKEDYAPYEQDIVKCVDWLIATPIDKEQEKRQEASAFFIKWVSGSPTVHVLIDGNIVSFMDEKTPEFLLVFMGGWVKNTIETGNYKNTVAKAEEDADGVIAGNMAGIEAVISFYNNNKKLLSKNKSIENYIKLQKKGKLKSYIEENIAKK
ncbi:MAG: hypothetical protein LBR52_00925 [Prevotellaceae bacterium]|nr:hypothetical protein [Prevotellaceae bacterium]